MLDGSEITSVRQAVEDADYCTVSFSAAVGDDQEGLCRDDSHSASVTVVDVPTVPELKCKPSANCACAVMGWAL